MIAYISYFLPSKPAYTSPFSKPQASSQQAVSKQAVSKQASKQSASSQQAVSKQSASVSKQSASSPRAKCPWNRRTLLSAFAMIVTISTPLWREVMERILWILW